MLSGSDGHDVPIVVVEVVEDVGVKPLNSSNPITASEINVPMSDVPIMTLLLALKSLGKKPTIC